MIRALLSAPRLQSLAITCSDQLKILAATTMSSLRELDYAEHEDLLEAFALILKNSTHLQKLRYKTYKSDLSADQSMDHQILPVLVNSFYQLTSLSLAFPGTIIFTQALQAISQIRTLQQVHIASGNQFGWRQTWLVDHRAIIRTFTGLHDLRRLAISGDTYANPRDYCGVDHYYHHSIYRNNLDENDSEVSDTDIFAGLDHMLNGEPNTQPTPFVVDMEVDDWSQPITSSRLEGYRRWERTHGTRMLRYARRYFKACAKLDWLYCGQIVMQTSDGIRPSAKQMTIRLSDSKCRTMLDSMFGCGLWKDGKD